MRRKRDRKIRRKSKKKKVKRTKGRKEDVKIVGNEPLV